MKNGQGMTWEEWKAAAGVRMASKAMRSAWERGEDPTEHRFDVMPMHVHIWQFVRPNEDDSRRCMLCGEERGA